MSKICNNCGFITEDIAKVCPMCGKALADGGDQPAPAPLHQVQPAPAIPPYPPAAPAAASPAAKPKKSWPYILIGVGAAAVIFTVALLIILLPGSKDKNSSGSGSAASSTQATAPAPTTAPATPSGTLAGTYRLTEATGTSSEEFESVKDDITLEIEPDGSATMYMYNSYELLTIDFDENLGVVYFQGSPVSYTFDGSVITIEDSSGKLVFEK